MFTSNTLSSRPTAPGMIHQGAPDPLEVRVNEDGADLVADQGQEAGDPLMDVRLSGREPTLSDLDALALEGLFGQKRMGYQRSPVPDIEKVVSIAIDEGADHHHTI